MAIDKINGTAFTNVANLDGVAKASIAKFNGQDVPVSIVTTNLIFHIDAANSSSYPGSGSTWTDIQGSNNVTLYNTPTYSTDHGGIISFDGVNEGGQTTSGTLLNAPITVDAWAKPQTTGSDGTIVGNWRQTGQVFLLWWDVGVTANFRAIYRPTPTSAVTTSESATRGTVNSWNHVSVSVDATNMKIYLDGTLQQTVSTGSINSPSGYRVGIAADYNGSPGATSRNLNGDIAAVKIYDRVLSASEVLQNYNALKDRF